MSNTPLLLTPGPTLVPPSVLAALARPMMHHRTQEFQAILKEAGDGLKKLFGTSQDVFILTSSGTGAMEAAVANLLSPGDEALVIRGGKFGERWGEICEAFGVKVTALDAVWGKPLDLKQLQLLLQQNPRTKAIFATLCETSTGVHYDIQAVKKTMGSHLGLLAVDAVSGLGSDPFAMDAYGVDVTVCGSQKGLMLPPGLAFIALNARAWEAAQSGRRPAYYLNLNLARQAWTDTDTPFTPGINLVVGLQESLRFILKDGLEAFVGRHQADARQLRQAIQEMGLELYTDPACASSAVTTIKVPKEINGKDLIKRMRAHGVVVAGGQGQELAGKVIRIATMGAVGRAELKLGLTALEKALEELGWKVHA